MTRRWGIKREKRGVGWVVAILATWPRPSRATTYIHAHVERIGNERERVTASKASRDR